VAGKLIKFINNGSTTAAVNVPQVDLPEQWAAPSVDVDPAQAEAEMARVRRRHRILHFHRNVPGVLSKLHSVIAELGANIAAEYLQTNQDVGYVVLDVDPTDADPIMDRVRAMPETIRARVLW
jgi:D-3-phosphoglycerate dehydrogenase / 2-oxoglutarate reductase